MNYHAFVHGESMKHSGPLTATPEDRAAGYPSFAAMKQLSPDFFIGAGDLVYYDATIRGNAVTVPEMRQCWHEQFHQARIRDFLSVTPAYWLKDDHDFRYNDADLTGDRQPTAATGIQLFQEQMPVNPMEEPERPGYRTHQIHPCLQLWMTEGRDHRSANRSDDGPEKTLWGSEQRAWLKETLLKSQARWKIIVSPTPMIGPDDGKKKDNHADLKGFQHERDEFFSWLADHSITGVMIFCGDRHWQFHSVHPSGIEEFGCGALNDENSRLGVAPGDADGSDPEGKIRQLFTSPEESGGFLLAECTPSADGAFRLTIALCDDHGKILHQSEYHDSLNQGQTGPNK
jgi:alkaline phosphatase/alkaline phosphatase D